MRLIAASTLDDYRRSGAYLIDLRTKEEYEKGHIEGAVNIPYDFLEDYKKRLPRNRLLVYKLKNKFSSTSGSDIDCVRII